MLKQSEAKPPHRRAASMEAASYLLRWIERGRQRSEQFGTWDELSEARTRLAGMEAEDIRVFVEVSV